MWEKSGLTEPSAREFSSDSAIRRTDMLILNDSAIAEASVLHTTKMGYFSLSQKVFEGGLQKWKEKILPMSGLSYSLESAKNTSNLYISQASFVRAKRTISLTQEINCCFVDLDCYNVGLQPDEMTVQAMLEATRKYGIPEPSYIVNSGCGMYAKWVFDKPVSAQHLEIWNNMEDTLIHMFSLLGADHKVRDVTRVLRVPSSVNSKNGGIVGVAFDSGKVYNFLELAQSVSQADIPREMRAVKAKVARIKVNQGLIEETSGDLSELVTFSAEHEPFMMKSMSVQSLHWSRFLDLRNLMLSRGGVGRGSRDLFLFWMMTLLSSARVINPETFWDEMSTLLRAFPESKDFQPMSDGSMSSIYKRLMAAAKGEKFMHKGTSYSPIYTPTNDHLINIFEISPEEEAKMITIISSNEKRRRRDLKVEGRAERRDFRWEERRVAATLKAEGLSITKIAEQIGKNKSTVSRWLTDTNNKTLGHDEFLKARLDAKRIEDFKARRALFAEQRAAEQKLRDERNQHLKDAQEAQEALRSGVRAAVMIAKVSKLIPEKDRSQFTGKTPSGVISSVRKIPIPESDLDAHQEELSL